MTDPMQKAWEYAPPPENAEPWLTMIQVTRRTAYVAGYQAALDGLPSVEQVADHLLATVPNSAGPNLYPSEWARIATAVLALIREGGE